MKVKASYTLLNNTITQTQLGEFFDSEREHGVINVFPAQRPTDWVGFGGAFTESAAYNYSLMSDENKQRTLEALFGESGLKYNFCRICIGSSDFGLNEYCYVEENDYDLHTFSIERDKKYVIPFIKDAISYAKYPIKLFASPWSPPAFMKDTNYRFQGGKLKAEYYELYAEYLIKFVKAYQEEGIFISVMSLQNEAKAKTTWESCQYTAEEEAVFAKVLRKRLNAHGLQLELLCWDHNKERLYERASATFDAAGDVLDGVGFHWYTGDHYGAIDAVRKQYPDKRVLLTEFCRSFSNIDHTTTAYAKEHVNVIANGAQGICEWNLILDENGGPYHNRPQNGGCDAPIRFNTSENTVNFSKIYYDTWMFSHFIQPHANTLYTSSFHELVQTCAVKNPDGSIVVTIVNRTGNEYGLLHLRMYGKALEISLPEDAIVTIILEP